MANAGAQFMDSVNNNTMSNNNNSSNINNNASFSPSLVATDRLESNNILRDVIVIGAEHAGAATIADVISNRNRNNSSGRTRNSSRDCNNGNTSSRRSRSRGRSRSSHRRSHSSHRNGRHHSRLRHKQQERNFPAALCSMITIVVISTALAEPRWIRIDSGSCYLIQAGLLNYLGAFQFFYNGHFIESDSNDKQNKHTITDYQFGPGVEDRMVNCVTDRGILLFKTVISLTFLAIVCSLCAFLLDLIGPSQRFLKLLRRSAIFDIITVFLCIVVTLLMYWISVIVMALQEQATQEGAPVISFDVSFYLITAAGITSVFAVACNCLRRYPFTENDSPPARAILDDQFNDDTENLLSLPPPIFHVQELPSMSNLPPPPPYTP